VIDTSNPTSPALVASVSMNYSEWTWGIAIAGNFAYVASFPGHLHVFDITNPLAPVRVALLALSGEPLDITVAGSHAFIACDNGVIGRLIVVDVSNPSAPIAVGSTDIRTRPRSVVGSGPRRPPAVGRSEPSLSANIGASGSVTIGAADTSPSASPTTSAPTSVGR
jgi:hypothetical protein